MNYSPLSSTSCSFPPLREICSLDPQSWTDNWVWAELDQASSCTFPGLLVESLEFLPTNQNKRTNLLKKLLILLKWMKHKARAYVVEPESSLSLNFKCHVREKKYSATWWTTVWPLEGQCTLLNFLQVIAALNSVYSIGPIFTKSNDCHPVTCLGLTATNYDAQTQWC